MVLLLLQVEEDYTMTAYRSVLCCSVLHHALPHGANDCSAPSEGPLLQPALVLGEALPDALHVRTTQYSTG